MENETIDHSVFKKPNAPRSNWELFKWMFFEPNLLKNYSKTITSKRTTLATILKVYIFYIAPLSICTWLVWVGFIAAFDIPARYPEVFRFDTEIYASLPNFLETFLFIAKELALVLAVVLALGLAVGLVLGLAVGLAVGLTGGLAVGLTGGLTVGFDLGLALALSLGMVEGLLFGLAGGAALVLTLWVALGLAFGLVGGLVGGLAGGLAVGLTGGLAGGLAFYILSFRLLFYPYWWLISWKKNLIVNNPYLHDEGIRFPIPHLNKSLIQESSEKPNLGYFFGVFLLSHRPHQLSFAIDIFHASASGTWLQMTKLSSSTFLPIGTQSIDILQMTKINSWARDTTNMIPGIGNSSKLPQFPTKIWFEKLKKICEYLTSAESNQAPVIKKEYYEIVQHEVNKFEQIHLLESFKGKELYFPVIKHWKTILVDQIAQLGRDTERMIVPLSPYAVGDALSPNLKSQSKVFLEREDLKEELSLKIHTSATVPTFILLGQRRTGKTSLLNFLPVLLSDSRFIITTIDCQSYTGADMPVFLQAWLQELSSEPGCDSLDKTNLRNDWLEAWDEFASRVHSLAITQGKKIILCMDEYDATGGFHSALNRQPQVGEQVLGRLRAFSQRQKEVIFMFVGAFGFLDLPGEVNWARFITNAYTLRVKYLSRKKSLQLITQPTEDYPLRYEAGVAEAIYEQTQGHPQLLQLVCSKMDNHANRQVKKLMSIDDLNHVLENEVILRDEKPVDIFWSEFCAEPAMRDAVLAISKHQPVDRSYPEVRKLLNYEYVVEESSTGAIRMRVPIFEKWILKHGY